MSVKFVLVETDFEIMRSQFPKRESAKKLIDNEMKKLLNKKHEKGVQFKLIYHLILF